MLWAGRVGQARMLTERYSVESDRGGGSLDDSEGGRRFVGAVRG